MTAHLDKVAIVLLLLASVAQGWLEGYHWSVWSGRKPPLITTRFDAYHLLTGLLVHGLPLAVLAAGLFGVSPLNVLGAWVFGGLGLREWTYNHLTRGHPLDYSGKTHLRFATFRVRRHPYLEAGLAVLGGLAAFA